MSDPSFKKHPKEVCESYINCPYCEICKLQARIDALRESVMKYLRNSTLAGREELRRAALLEAEE